MNKCCTVCHHADRPQIDRGLLAGAVGFFLVCSATKARLSRNILKI